MTDRDPLYRRHRFPAEITVHAVWLYFRFPLSLRMVEDMLAAREGGVASHQTVFWLWGEKFGRLFANEICRRSSGRFGDKWHFDETVVSIRGKKHGLWRTVDQDGFVLDVLVQSRRNAKAAKPDAQTVEGLGTIAAGDGHRQASLLRCRKAGYHAGCRASLTQELEPENSHQPIRRRERIMKRFKSQRHLQRFVSIHDPIANLFHIPTHDISSSHHRELRSEAMNLWVKIARA